MLSGSERGSWYGVVEGIRMDWKLVSNRMVFTVGNGRMVRFWRDKWCGDSPL